MTNIDIVSTTAIDEESEQFLPYYLGSTPEEAEETYELFSWLMGVMASSYARNTDVPMEDYFAEAITGLARAKRDWDPTRGGCQFRTFAILKVKNALNECCRKQSRVVNVPAYVRVAHTYITNIKTILEGYDVIQGNIDFAIKTGECPALAAFAPTDINRVNDEIRKLKKLSKNSGVEYEKLVKRSEYVPSEMSYDESMSQEELHKRERRKLAAAMLVSKLEDHMTDEELHVAHGIMAGHSYAEISRSHSPKRSIAWVADKVNGMREKFQAKIKEGL